MFSSLSSQVGLVVSLVVCGGAITAGGREERFAGVTIIVAWIVTAAVQDRRFPLSPDWGDFAVDVVLLALLTWLMLGSTRTWLLFATAYQLLIVATHLAMAIDVGIGLTTYVVAIYVWSYLVLAALAAGALTRKRPPSAAPRLRPREQG